MSPVLVPVVRAATILPMYALRIVPDPTLVISFGPPPERKATSSLGSVFYTTSVIKRRHCFRLGGSSKVQRSSVCKSNIVAPCNGYYYQTRKARRAFAPQTADQTAAESTRILFLCPNRLFDMAKPIAP